MADYARIYGFRIYTAKEIKGREEEYVMVAKNSYISIGDFELLEEIMDKDL